MFHNIARKLTGILLALLIAGMPLTVYADGSTSIMLSGNSTEVGKKVTVTVSGSDSSKLSLRYNNNVLKFQSCSASGYTTDGNVISFNGKSAKITFEAVDAGSGDLVVSSDVLSGSSASVKVAATAQPVSEPEAKPEEDKEEEDTEKSEDKSEEQAKEDTDKSKKKTSNASDGEGDYIIDGTAYVLSERFTDREIPDGYSRIQLKIHGGTYRELTNGTLTLVYLKPADHIEGSGVFYLYDEESDSVSDFTILGSGKYYVVVEEPEEAASDLFTEAKLTVKDTSYPAYQAGEGESDFYYVYGTDALGDTGWFSYDAVDETIQRANMELLQRVSAPEPEEEETVKSEKKEKKNKGVTSELMELVDSLTSSRTMLAAVIFVVVVLLIILLDILLFRRRSSYDDDEDDYFDDDYERDEKKENDGPEVLTADNLLEAEDFEEANKPHRGKKRSGKGRQTDIWDTSERKLSDMSDLPVSNDDHGKLKKQVFRGRGVEAAPEAEENKVDVIDFNDL